MQIGMRHTETAYRRDDFITALFHDEICQEAPETLTTDGTLLRRRFCCDVFVEKTALNSAFLKSPYGILLFNYTFAAVFELASCSFDCEQYLLAQYCNCTLPGPSKLPFNESHICNITDIVSCDVAFNISSNER